MTDSGPPIAEIRNLATSLGGTDPETPIGADAADALSDTVTDASLVALGETSHGARAQFQLKHRLIRFLVEEMGFRAFALEEDANWVRQVDAYVADGEGDIEDLLLSARINWPWKTREMVDLFDWMRTFNEGSQADDLLRVYGFDTTSFGRVADVLSRFFDAVDAGVPDVRDHLDALAGEDEKATFAAAEWLIDALPPLFEEYGGEWAERCTSREFVFVRRQPTLLAQTLELATADAGDRFTLRDKAMAANASWVVGDADADRAVLWAHNVHVARGKMSDGIVDYSGRTMGDRLDERHGDEYVPIGIGLGGGEYLAIDAQTMEPVTPSVPEPPAGSIPDTFSRLDAETPFVPTASLHGCERIADWLVGETQYHRISGMVENGESLTYVASDLSEFDGFGFVETTAPTRHLALDG